MVVVVAMIESKRRDSEREGGGYLLLVPVCVKCSSKYGSI